MNFLFIMKLTRPYLLPEDYRNSEGPGNSIPCDNQHEVIYSPSKPQNKVHTNLQNLKSCTCKINLHMHPSANFHTGKSIRKGIKFFIPFISRFFNLLQKSRGRAGAVLTFGLSSVSLGNVRNSVCRNLIGR